MTIMISAYVFGYKQGEYLMLMHTIRACFIKLDYFLDVPPNLLLSGQPANLRLPKIFVPWSTIPTLAFRDRYPGLPIAYPSDLLNPVRKWLRDHHEYLAGEYLMHRLYHDKRIATDDISQADLCFPSCSGVKNYQITTGNTLTLQVKSGSEGMFSGCTFLYIGIETLASQCSFNVPYWHSVYYPGFSMQEPWKLNVPRTKLLCYVGGITRGNARDRISREMENFHINPSHSYFFTHIVTERTGSGQLFVDAWEMYASSVFSWQPEGDTETRRAFYDSWMFGCIPVISRSTACTYGGLFGGRLFAQPMPALEEIVVVLDDSDMRSGTSIIRHLLDIPANEIYARQQRMAKIAPIMQWGWGRADSNSTYPDALVATLSVFTGLGRLQ